MDGQRGYGECGVERAKSIDIVDHTQEDRWRKGGVGGESLQVIDDADARWGARMEPGQSSIFQRNLIIETDELHEHVADEDDQVLGVAGLILGWHVFDRCLCRSSTLGGGGGAAAR